MRTFGPMPYGPREGFAAHHARAPFLRRDPSGTVALTGGGYLRRCPSCGAHVLEYAEACTCPACSAPPATDHDGEGREHVHAAIADVLRRGGVRVPRGDQ